MAIKTSLLKFYAKRRLQKLSSEDFIQQQERELLSLIRKAEKTQFGEDHNFTGIHSVENYQTIVPLRSYEQFWDTYWKNSFPTIQNKTWPGTVGHFAVSSGTTSGTTKYIPCSQEMIQQYRKAGLDLLVHHIHNNPGSKILDGKSFVLGGSTEFVEQASGIYSGDISGIMASRLPWWIKSSYFPPEEILCITDWEEKITRMGTESLTENIRTITGVPSWLLILFDSMEKLSPKWDGTLQSIYPNLEMIVHGGVNFAPYMDRFQELLKGSKAELRETYPASEAFLAIADRGPGEGMRLLTDHGVFFEFVPLEELNSVSPTRHWVKTIEPDINYAVILTSCSGVWSYILGDTVKFVDLTPPRLLVTGRTSYALSAFGEHLINEEIEDAVSVAARSIGIQVTDYTVAPVYPEKQGELGGHQFVVEASRNHLSHEQIHTFSKALDQRLCERNEDYEAHRAEGYGLRDPQVFFASPGMFAGWMKSRGKLGGQNKVPRIISDREQFDHLMNFSREFAEKDE